MKVVLLAGGFGTRINEESQFKPKPMIEIGGKPILWHIMKQYSFYGFNEFIICAGYKQQYIKEYFNNYFLHNSDVTFDMQNHSMVIHHNCSENWKVTVVDTGLNTLTGGRVKRIKEYLDKNEPFLLTYGDGVSNVNILETIKFHNYHKKLITMTGFQPEGRFGVLDISSDNSVNSFREKDKDDMGWINAGFMVVDPKVLDYIDGDNIMFEREPMQKVAQLGQLVCFKHYGFWQCMDTLKDKEKLEKMWCSGNAPWKVWDK